MPYPFERRLDHVIDGVCRRRYPQSQLRGLVVKAIFGALLFCLLGAMICVSAALLVDDPNTAFNEADTPVCLARPTSARFSLAPPVADSIILPSLSLRWASFEFDNLARGFTPLATPGEPRSLQKLLCTFLI